MQQLLIILLPAFLLGILHTAIPCEDKALFCFWSIGISKNPKRSILIIVLYGLGLMSANLLIAFITVLISLIPRFFGLVADPYVINFLGAFSSTFAAIFLLFYMTRREFEPHSKGKYEQEIPNLNFEKKKTPYFFGILAGFPPCIFELIIYSQCFNFSLSYSFAEGILIVFYFSLGTFIGLFPLALAKQGTSYFVKSREKRNNRILFIMIFIIVLFNSIIMILSFFRMDVFPVVNL